MQYLVHARMYSLERSEPTKYKHCHTYSTHSVYSLQLASSTKLRARLVPVAADSDQLQPGLATLTARFSNGRVQQRPGSATAGFSNGPTSPALSLFLLDLIRDVFTLQVAHIMDIAAWITSPTRSYLGERVRSRRRCIRPS